MARRLSPSFAILGGGPAGLAAAFKLSQQGWGRVAVFERGPDVGGNAGSFVIDGIPVDFGSHRLHPVTPPAVMNDIRTLEREAGASQLLDAVRLQRGGQGGFGLFHGHRQQGALDQRVEGLLLGELQSVDVDQAAAFTLAAVGVLFPGDALRSQLVGLSAEELAGAEQWQAGQGEKGIKTHEAP